jgi:hypothetical protein
MYMMYVLLREGPELKQRAGKSAVTRGKRLAFFVAALLKNVQKEKGAAKSRALVQQ